MADQVPSTGVRAFGEWLTEHDTPAEGRVVDIGMGKGRNAIYFAELGYEVYGIEYIAEAIEVAKKLADQRGVSNRLTVQEADIDAPWNFPDNYFDIAIDSFATVDVETKTGREVCRDEMLRTLKVGGLALVLVCSNEDEWEKEMISSNPGPELNSTLWPETGKFQKDYDEAELREFYKDFEVVELQTIKKQVEKLGRSGVGTNFWMVLRKASA